MRLLEMHSFKNYGCDGHFLYEKNAIKKKKICYSFLKIKLD